MFLKAHEHTHIHSINDVQNIYKAAVAVFAYPGCPAIVVCPPVQENLDDLEVAFLGSTVEGSIFILHKHRETTRYTGT